MYGFDTFSDESLIGGNLFMTEIFGSFMAFVQASDWLIVSAVFILLIMSVAVWTLIVVKTIQFWRSFQQKKEAFSCYEKAQSTRAMLDAAPKNAWVQFGTASQDAFHSLDGNRVLMDEQRKVHQANFLRPYMAGLGVLSTIAATAPFVGLFGTVVGIYHTMTSLSALDVVPSIAQVAGPVGETLVMTAAGIAVAVPAAIGYNMFVHATRSLSADLTTWWVKLHYWKRSGKKVETGS